MGLDTTHNAFSGAYSSFNSWRTWLSKKCGFHLRDMVGFGGTTEWTVEKAAHPLYPLLSHSDCDGELTVEECKTVQRGLAEIITQYNGDEEDKDMIDACIRFRNGCNLAISKKEPIKFQ